MGSKQQAFQCERGRQNPLDDGKAGMGAEGAKRGKSPSSMKASHQTTPRPGVEKGEGEGEGGHRTTDRSGRLESRR